MHNIPFKQSAYFAYSTAVGAVSLAFVVRLALQPILGNQIPFLLFLLPIMIAASFGGRRVGLFATTLSGLLSWYFFLEPYHSSPAEQLRDTVSIALFSIMGVSISLLGGTLQLSETLKSAILNSSLDAIVTSDVDGRIVEWNEAAERIFGYARNDVLGKDMAELIIPPSMRDAHRRGMERMKRTGEGPVLGKKLEMPAMREDGSTFPSELIITKIQSDPRRFTGFIRDLTEQKRAEETLKVHTHVLERMAEGVSMATEEGIIIYSNPAEDEMFGYERGELLGKHVSVLNSYPPEENERIVRDVIERLQAKGSWSGEFVNKTKQGTVFTTFARITALELAGEKLWVCVHDDITERKRQENALRESEERFRTMADSAPVLIWMSGPDKEGVYFNRRWLEFTGRPLEDELGEGWHTSIHPDDIPNLEARSAAFKEKRPFNTQFRMRRFDGEYRYMLDTGVPRFTGDGTFQGYIGSCSDITELKRFEEERTLLLTHERELRGQAELASRMKDEFLATLSHELRTPLNAILGWSQVVRRRKNDPEQLRKGLDVVERNARSQAQIIEDLLDMNRIVSGKVRLDIQGVDLAQVITDAAETARPAADAKGVELEILLSTPTEPIKGDPQRLQQVLWNLLSNAVKFTPSGGKVQVQVERLESDLVLSVSDTGIGLEKEFLPFVFDRFRQADASITRKHGGLGLGLSIVRSLVELHGGTVSVKSEGLGKGSTFIVSLPARAAAYVEEEVTGRFQLRAEEAVLRIEPVDLRGVTILAVDDEPDARQLIRELLKESGADVITAGSAEEALKLLKEHMPHVLVSDIGMPEVDGYEFLRKVRNLSSDRGGKIPAIALTAFARPEDRLLALKAGYNTHVPKPVESAELMQVIVNLSRPV